MAATTQQHDNKLDYVVWQGFRNCLSVLRARYSWGQMSDLFKKDDAGWAERADQHRSIVTENDVRLARELVQQLPTAEPSPPKVKRVANNQPVLSDLEHAEIRKRLSALFERYGSWSAAVKAMGKNEGTSYHYRKVAAGTVNGSKRLLDTLRKVETSGPLAPPNGANGRVHDRGDSLDSAGQLEVQQLLQRLYKKHTSWRAVSEIVGSGNAKSYYGKLARRGGGRSKALLNRLRTLDGDAVATTPHMVTNYDRDAAAAEEANQAAAARTKEMVASSIHARELLEAESLPWPAQAQGYLRTALGIVEENVQTLPKALQAAAGDLTSQIQLAIDELDSGSDDDSDETS